MVAIGWCKESENRIKWKGDISDGKKNRKTGFLSDDVS